MSDVVERLRWMTSWDGHKGLVLADQADLRDAAAEITRLRAIRVSQEAEIARLRGEVAELTDKAPTGLCGRGA